MEKRTFKLSEVSKIFNIKRHFVIRLVETGVIKPFEDIRGRGKSRQYSYENLIEIGIFLHLNRLKISHAMAASIVQYFRDNWGGFQLDEALKDILESISYISVFGFLNGETQTLAKIDLYPPRVTPEEAIRFLVKSTIEEGRGINKQSFAYYFLVDVKNIVDYVNKRIETL